MTLQCNTNTTHSQHTRSSVVLCYVYVCKWASAKRSACAAPSDFVRMCVAAAAAAAAHLCVDCVGGSAVWIVLSPTRQRVRACCFDENAHTTDCIIDTYRRKEIDRERERETATHTGGHFTVPEIQHTRRVVWFDRKTRQTAGGEGLMYVLLCVVAGWLVYGLACVGFACDRSENKTRSAGCVLCCLGVSVGELVSVLFGSPPFILRVTHLVYAQSHANTLRASVWLLLLFCTSFSRKQCAQRQRIRRACRVAM